jgi:hypothetical protein
MKRCMSNNHPGLLTKLIPIMFIDSQKIYMVLNKPLELGMVDLVLFFFLNDFVRGQNDTTLFTKNKGNGILLVQVYVDDIISGSTNSALPRSFLL